MKRKILRRLLAPVTVGALVVAMTVASGVLTASEASAAPSAVAAATAPAASHKLHPTIHRKHVKHEHLKLHKGDPHRGGRGGDPGDDYPLAWKNAPQDSLIDNFGEYNRECVSFAAWALFSRNGFTMPFHDNANAWGHDAQVRGFRVDDSPAVGAIAWSNAGTWGHVAWVVAVAGDQITIEDYNHNLNGRFSVRTANKNAFTGYIHFKDLPTPGSVTVTTTPDPTPYNPQGGTYNPQQPTNQPVQGNGGGNGGGGTPPTYAETTGPNGSGTFTDRSNAGGTVGQRIGGNTTVTITCKAQGFAVADGNTNWYLVATDPWSNQFWAPADNFWNGGSGDFSESPFVDGNVRDC